jgi:DNA polymerase elongation subunit (family B)
MLDHIDRRILEENNSAEIARELVNIFEADVSIASATKKINRRKKKLNISPGNQNGKGNHKPYNLNRTRRLLFDIETSPCKGWFYRPGYNVRILPHQIIEYGRIICISYKWHGEDIVHNLRWDENQNDKQMLLEFMEIMNKADECIAHNGDRFDEKWLRTRCIYHRISAFPKYRTLDTLKKARSGFNFPSNKLDEIGKYLGVGRKIKIDPQVWEDVFQRNDREKLQEMVDYCDQDVLLLEDIYNVLFPYITNNTNLTVLNGGEKFHCSNCASHNTHLSKTATTTMGTVQRWMKCKNCGNQFKITNKAYMDYCELKMKKDKTKTL